MPGDDQWFEPTGDELDDRESPDDDFDDESTETVPCCQCGAQVYEDAIRCPACGAYLTHHTSLWSGRPGWWILLGLLGILAVILALAGFSVW
jgi:hypothetical protein